MWCSGRVLQVKLTNEEIQFINAFESLSGVAPRDCIVDGESIIYLVKKEAMGKAIGRHGSTIKKIKQRLGKSVEVMEFCNDAKTFLEKALREVKFKEISLEDDINGKKCLSVALDSENKRKLLSSIGRLKKAKKVLSRNYGIAGVKTR